MLRRSGGRSPIFSASMALRPSAVPSGLNSNCGQIDATLGIKEAKFHALTALDICQDNAVAGLHVRDKRPAARNWPALDPRPQCAFARTQIGSAAV